ncbi:ABC transporter substrate-binding protein [Chelatococcus asaccharovorans]|uniref:ABC transporter substrate-binding protein n=1 Tax=Chelatococcus asaccharovorans TaxID=28210 RepID=UPI00224C7ADE|nr:ABC transporter substrate-binding protein [Chelatococcus asaccharovorans]CAH1659690.1 Amino acid/amide ABC transporter substrate-binding protein (HAAT family) [Chelatococcus asaccharovorans]CAH1684099.1 Amino acid/amide ABC transporter substrate-binding protein (HAAT family) [Chelatococcus asaccharovorans]
MTISRQLAFGLAAGLAAACALLASASFADEVKIGLVSTQTGTFAANGAEMLRGTQFAVDEANAAGGIAGFTVSLATADDEGTPEGARRVAERLTLDGYRILTGPVFSSVVLALANQLSRWDAILFSGLAKSDRITGEACSPRLFHLLPSDSMDMAAFRPWLKTRPEKKIAIIAADFAWGQDSSAALKTIAAEEGRNVVATIMTPLGNKDFGPYIQQLSASGAQIVVTILGGQDAINFVNQAAGYAFSTGRVVAGIALLTQPTIDATGSNMRGYQGEFDYAPTIETPENVAFTQSWMQKFGKLPSRNEAEAYLAVKIILHGVRLSGSNDPKAIAKALSGADVPTLLGTLKLRKADNQLLRPEWFGEVQSVGGALRPVPQAEYAPEVIERPVSPACKMRSL